MKKSFIFVLAAVAGLAGIAIGLAAGRSNLIRVPKVTSASVHVLPARGTASVKNVAAQQSGQLRVVRFASNPQPIPPFLARDIDGNVVSTAEWQGKVVLLNFWATWCPPCREEIPELIDLQTRYKDRLQVVGISIDDPEDLAAVKKFTQREGVNYPIRYGHSRNARGIRRGSGTSDFFCGEHGKQSRSETRGIVSHLRV